MDDLVKLDDLLTYSQKDANDFFVKGNKAAGTRLRKKMQEIKVLAQKVRESVSETKNA
ncbi:MAG: histone H1 [Smithella sp.]